MTKIQPLHKFLGHDFLELCPHLGLSKELIDLQEDWSFDKDSQLIELIKERLLSLVPYTHTQRERELPDWLINATPQFTTPTQQFNHTTLAMRLFLRKLAVEQDNMVGRQSDEGNIWRTIADAADHLLIDYTQRNVNAMWT